jgi:multidrug efflux pump subunit AcrA (membrane-fusion protein)
LAEDQYTTAVDQANSAKSSANAQISSAQSQLSTAQAALQTATDNLSEATLTAPHAGTIASINGTVGGTPGSGSGSGSGSGASSSSSSGFIVIDDLSTFQVVAQVNEADIAKVAVGQTATFTVSAFGTQRFLGTVASLSPQGTSSSGVVTYPVTINVTMSAVGSAHLLPQMTANLAIITAQRTGVLLVPASAVSFARTAVSAGLVTRAQVLTAVQQAQQLLPTAPSVPSSSAPASASVAFVLERSGSSGGSFVVKPVVLGLSNGTSYEVVAGLANGETVVTGQTGGTSTTSSTTTGGTGGFGGFGGGGGGGRFGGGGGGGGGSGSGG